MAQPAGSIVPTDIPYSVTSYDSTAPEYLYFAFKLPLMPSHWVDNDNIFGLSTIQRRCRVEVSSQIEVEAGHNGIIRWYFDDARYLTQTKAGAISQANWQSAADIDKYIDGKNFPLGLGNVFGSFYTPRYQTGYCEVYKSDSGKDFHIYALHIRCIVDLGYTDPSADHRELELTDRATAANRLYTPHRACSAWHVQQALVHSVNKIMWSAVWGATFYQFN